MQTPDAFNPYEVEVTRQWKIKDPHASEHRAALKSSLPNRRVGIARRRTSEGKGGVFKTLPHHSRWNGLWPLSHGQTSAIQVVAETKDKV